MLTRYCAPRPSTRGSFGGSSQSVWHAAGSARQCGGTPSVGFVRDGAVECSQGYSHGTHRVLTRVRCAPPPGRGPTAPSAAHVCRTTACTLRWVSGIALRGTWLAMLAGYSTGTRRPSTARTEAHPSLPTAAAAARGTCIALPLHAFYRVRSADARSDTRADQRRRHQPADARDDVRADARAELRRPDG